MKPQDAQKQYSLGSILMALNEFQPALPYLEFSARANPRQREYLYMLGGCYLELDQFQMARTTLERPLRLDSSFAKAYLLAARIELGRSSTKECRRFMMSNNAPRSEGERHPVARGIADSLGRFRSLTGGTAIGRSLWIALNAAREAPNICIGGRCPVRQNSRAGQGILVSFGDRS